MVQKQGYFKVRNRQFFLSFNKLKSNFSSLPLLNLNSSTATNQSDPKHAVGLSARKTANALDILKP